MPPSGAEAEGSGRLRRRRGAAGAPLLALCKPAVQSPAHVAEAAPSHTHTQVNLAAKRSTSWVDVECQKATGSYAGGARPLRRAVKLVAKAAVAGWLLRRFVLRGDLPGVDWVAKRLGTDSQTATR